MPVSGGCHHATRVGRASSTERPSSPNAGVESRSGRWRRRDSTDTLPDLGTIPEVTTMRLLMSGAESRRHASPPLGIKGHVFERRHVALRIVLIAVVATLSACLGSQSGPPAASGTAAPASPTASATAVPPDWRSRVDTKAGYALRYPPSWMEVPNQGPGTHAFGSRPALTSLTDLGASDTWLTVRSFAPDPSIHCGEPVQYDSTAAVSLDRIPAKEFVRTGTQSDAQARVVDVIAVKGETCFALQLTLGRNVAQQGVVLMGTFASSFRFGG